MAICYKTHVYDWVEGSLWSFSLMRQLWELPLKWFQPYWENRFHTKYKLIALVLMTIQCYDSDFWIWMTMTEDSDWKWEEKNWKFLTMMSSDDDIGDEWQFTSDSGKDCSRKPHICHHVTSALVGSRSNNIAMTMIKWRQWSVQTQSCNSYLTPPEDPC